MEEYDDIAEKYSFREDPIRDYVSIPSFLEVLGNINGKTVLDVGCGSGFITRKIKLLGAKKVVGIDISQEMIKLAIKTENENPLGIKYFVKDIKKAGIIEEFDIITAGFLLHYSKNKNELKKMCKSIFGNLKEGGRFVTINLNPDNPLSNNKKYGAIITGQNPLKEGDKIKVTHFDENDNEIFSFYNFHWLRNTYEKALIDSGFKQVKWYPMKVSAEGIKRFGDKYWKDYLSEPRLIIIEAVK